MLRSLLLIFVIFCIKKPFISSDSVCYSFDFGLIDDVPVVYVYESLFQLQTSKILSLKPKLALQLLLLLSGDIELCPGLERSIPELEAILNLRGMHVFHHNIGNLLNKKGHVMEILNSFKNVHILTLSETHINKDVGYGNVFNIPGYEFVNRPRQTGFGGGVAAYIKHGINWKRRLDLESEFLECLCIEISPKNVKSFVIIIMYRPPDTSKHLHKDFNQLLAQLLPKSSNSGGYERKLREI